MYQHDSDGRAICWCDTGSAHAAIVYGVSHPAARGPRTHCVQSGNAEVFLKWRLNTGSEIAVNVTV
jgi:hypothetical protein